MDPVRFHLFGTFRASKEGRQLELPDRRYLTYLKLLLLSGKKYLERKNIPSVPDEHQIRDIVDRANLPESKRGRYGFRDKTGVEIRFRAGSGVYLRGSWTCDLVDFEQIWSNRTTAAQSQLEWALEISSGGIDPQLCQSKPEWFEGRLSEIANRARDIGLEIDRRFSKARGGQHRHERGPLLELPRVTTDAVRKEARRFYYGERAVPLIGRSEAFDHLQRFIDSDAGFTWWAITGEAGSGKSRLALELMLSSLERGWKGGFWAIDDRFDDWLYWNPSGDTLMIVDYVVERFASIQEMLAMLARANNRANSQHQLRVLLLERKSSDLWWQLLTAGESNTDQIVLNSLYDPQPLKLRTLDFESVGQILQLKLPSIVDEVRNRLARVFLQSIDRQGRPLFAAMFADAHRTNPDALQVPRWSHIDLTSTVLRKEASRWQSVGARHEDINLLAFATITGSVRFQDLESDALKLLVVNGKLPPTWNDQTMEALAALGEEWDPNSPRITAIQPDFLGEYFVLQRLSGQLRLDPNRAPLPVQIAADTRDLLHAAWLLAPDSALGFHLRCFTDHPHLAENLGLREPPAGIEAPTFAYHNLLRAASDFHFGMSLLDRIERECQQLDARIYNVLIDQAADLEQANAVVARLRAKQVTPTSYTLNSLLAKTKTFSQALELTERLESEGWEPDIVTFNTLLSRVPSDQAMEFFEGLEAGRLSPTVVTFNSLMSKMQSIYDALDVLKRMKVSGLAPSNVTLRILIQKAPSFTLARQIIEDEMTAGSPVYVATFNELIAKGTFQEGMDILSWIEKLGLEPVGMTFTYLLSRATTADQIEQGLRLMKRFGFVPSTQIVTHYVAKSPSFKDAEARTSQLLEEGLGWNATVLSSLVSKAGSIAEAKQFLANFKEKMPVAADLCSSPMVIAALVTKAESFEAACELVLQQAPGQLDQRTLQNVIRMAPTAEAAFGMVKDLCAANVRINENTISCLVSKAESLSMGLAWLRGLGEFPWKESYAYLPAVVVSALVSLAETWDEGLGFLESLGSSVELNESVFTPLFSKAPSFEAALELMSVERSKDIEISETSYCGLAARAETFDQACLVLAPETGREFVPSPATFDLLASKSSNVEEATRAIDLMRKAGLRVSKEVLAQALRKCATEKELRDICRTIISEGYDATDKEFSHVIAQLRSGWAGAAN